MRMGTRTCGALLAALLALCATSCRCESRSNARPHEGGPAELAPLVASSWLLELEVAGFGAARVAVPLGALSPRPLVVALHGDVDRPEWPCGSYHHAANRRALVLCPRGVSRAGGERFTLGSAMQTSQELRAALPALKARFGKHLAKGPAVLAALGPSVDHAIDIARQEPNFFAYLVLVDGSLERLTPPIAARYAEAGGKRVLFICTIAGCDPDLARKALSLRSGGVDVRVHRVARGFGLDSETARALRKEWEWLVQGDPRW